LGSRGRDSRRSLIIVTSGDSSRRPVIKIKKKGNYGKYLKNFIAA